MTVMFVGSAERISQDLETRCEAAEIPFTQTTIGDARKEMATKPLTVAAVVVDARALTEPERSQLTHLLVSTHEQNVPISVFFEKMTKDDIYDVFFGPSNVDQVVEVRTGAEVTEALKLILEHASNRIRQRVPGYLLVGSTFQIPETAGKPAYREARSRSLVSQRMGGFGSELRATAARLKVVPLAPMLPWDPTDAQDSRLAEKGADGWKLRVRTGQTPNLTQVLNAHRTEDARQRLDGHFGKADWQPGWAAKWEQKPPAVLITGESGTGKTLVAKEIARMLMREQTGPIKGRLVKINCGALTATNIEHVLMGSAPGNWTGIDEAVAGELARGAHGVIFFDEIGDLDPDVQRALLTFLDDRLIRPTNISPYNGFQHILAATNRDLEVGVNERWFRNDLLARFAIKLEIPPLRSRGEDEIGQLADFLAQNPRANPIASDGKRLVQWISPDAHAELLRREYREGNFRELTSTVHAAIQSAARRYSRSLEVEDLPDPPGQNFRSDRESNTVRVGAVPIPPGTAVVEVESLADLRLVSTRESKVILIDEVGVGWVCSSGVFFRCSSSTPA